MTLTLPFPPLLFRSRRRLLAGGVLSASAVLLLSGREALAQAAAANPQGDVNILNVALALEYEAINAYQLGASSGLLQKPVLDVALRFQSDHKAHRDALAPPSASSAAHPRWKRSSTKPRVR